MTMKHTISEAKKEEYRALQMKIERESFPHLQINIVVEDETDEHGEPRIFVTKSSVG